MYRAAAPRLASAVRGAHAHARAVPTTRRLYATKGAAPPPPPKLSFTERLRNKLWRPGAVPQPEEADQQLAAAAAPPAARKPSDIPGYVEALDARDLPVVGLDPALEEWDVPVFITNTKFTSPSALVRAVHRAVIEVHTPLLNGLPASAFSSRYTGPEQLTPRVRITVSSSGGGDAVFDFRSPEIEQDILATLEGGAEGAEVRAYSEEEVYPAEQQQGEEEEQAEWVVEGLERRGWAALGVKEEVRFALVKRVAQLTGVRMLDAEAGAVKTVAELLEHLETKTKPKKLFEIIAQTPLPDLPNVKVYETRLRPWDKERMIGRERPFEKVVEFKYPFEARDRK
ncbi:uncharacterized protein LAJ45_09586 [Morchella importuna]|uniref:uncharacterized protein n=1 Tax=Morchella importuna TaxID=1174673 RepID=UPI001E8CC986|nr:uncharacterized protein LAJ45_09586 [Morchella importuna]KAH8146393.1 hypothetical protein LAJ45_09586 [Morchella importuna]